MKGLDYTEKMWTSYMVNHLTASSRSRDVLRERDIAGTMESGEGGEERWKEGRSGLPDFLPAALPASHVPVPSFAAYLEQIIRAAFRRDL